MKVQLYFESSQAGLAEHEEWNGKECKILIRTTSSCNCSIGYVEGITSEMATVTFTGPQPDVHEECIENIGLVFEDKEYRIARYEIVIDDFAAGNPEYVLPDEIIDQPWNISYDLGTGIDAVTNLVKNKAVVVNQKSGSPEYTWNTDIKAHLYTTGSNVSSLFSTSIAGRVTVSSLDLEGSLQYLKSVKCSETSSSIVLTASYIESVYPGNCEFKLTDKAAALLDNPTKFRNQFGDYFVSDIRKGGYFIAVYNCEANSVENIKQFNASLSMDAKNLAFFTTGNEFKELIKKYHIRLKTQIFCRGCDELPTTDIQKALEWFNQHKSPVPYLVRLKHYSSLTSDGKYPKTIDYSFDTLQEIKTVYYRFSKLYAEVQSVHKNYEEEIREKFHPIYDAATMCLKTIAEDKDYRRKLLEEIHALQTRVTSLLLMQKKYFAIKAMKQLEPLAGEDHKQKTNRKEETTWSYGCFDYPGAKGESESFKKEGHGGPCHKKFIHKDYSNKTIVGYRLISNWDDGTNGDWWKLSNYGLLDHKLDIRVDSYHGRGFDWTFEIYTVDNKDINFAD